MKILKVYLTIEMDILASLTIKMPVQFRVLEQNKVLF